MNARIFARMNFRIADTFTDSLARLSGIEQKAVKTTAFDLQVNPAQPGLKFHRVDRTKDPNFWSVRVNRDIRVIVHRTPKSPMTCYVDHHDNAYRWAEKRKLEVHLWTEAAQGSGFPFRVLDEGGESAEGRLSIATMHLAKGLEFRAVAVMACDDEIIPRQERIETAADESDLEEVYDTERHLLYVACTRARDDLMVSGVLPGSEFMDDLGV